MAAKGRILLYIAVLAVCMSTVGEYVALFSGCITVVSTCKGIQKMNLFFGMFMESCVHGIMKLQVSCKANEASRASFALQEARSIHNSTNRPEIECIANIDF